MTENQCLRESLFVVLDQVNFEVQWWGSAHNPEAAAQRAAEAAGVSTGPFRRLQVGHDAGLNEMEVHVHSVDPTNSVAVAALEAGMWEPSQEDEQVVLAAETFD